MDPKVKTMIACAQCRTTNTLDSTFCRRCGAALAADVLIEARAELDALVAKGTAAFEDGRVDDAMAIAEEAVLTDPAHANAHALKGMIHERRGEVAKALEEYERVCDLSPDSALDRIRLSGLRSALAERATATPDRRTPLLAGVSAAVLLACVGIAAAKMMPPAKAPTDPTATRTLVASSDAPVAETPSAPNRVAAQRPNTTLQPGDVPPIGATNPSVIETPALSGASGGDRSGATLPRARADRSGGLGGDPSSIEIRPMQVPMGQIGGGQAGSGLPSPGGPGFPSAPTSKPPTGKTPSNDGLDPVPQPTGPSIGIAGNTGGSAPRSTPRKDNGVIDIQVEKGSSRSGGATSAPETSANGAEALTRVGKAHAQGGDFDRAAKAYERALAAGADPASTNQRLGQAYDRMGRKADAKAAYARAADGYRRKVSSGKADDRDRNGLDSVNQAMKVLDRG